MISKVEREGRGTAIGNTRVLDRHFAGTVLDDCTLRDWRPDCHPSEDFRKHVPEILERRKNRQLVLKHVRPHHLKRLAIGLQGYEGGQGDCLVIALLPEHVEQDRGCWPAVRVAVEVHDVIEIARTCSLSERAQLFTKGFFVGITIRPDSAFRLVAVRMKNFAAHGRQHKPFIRSEIELYLGPAARCGRNRPTIRDLALAVGFAARVVVDLELKLVGRNVQSGLFRDPGNDFFEYWLQEFLIKMTFIAQSEIQIL